MGTQKPVAHRQNANEATWSQFCKFGIIMLNNYSGPVTNWLARNTSLQTSPLTTFNWNDEQPNFIRLLLKALFK